MADFVALCHFLWRVIFRTKFTQIDNISLKKLSQNSRIFSILKEECQKKFRQVHKPLVAGKMSNWQSWLNRYFLHTAVQCPRLRIPNHGHIYPESCHLQSWNAYQTRCAFACKKGFQLEGPSLRTCEMPGIWDGGFQMTRCVGKKKAIICVGWPILHFAWICRLHLRDALKMLFHFSLLYSVRRKRLKRCI